MFLKNNDLHRYQQSPLSNLPNNSINSNLYQFSPNSTFRNYSNQSNDFLKSYAPISLGINSNINSISQLSSNKYNPDSFNSRIQQLTSKLIDDNKIIDECSQKQQYLKSIINSDCVQTMNDMRSTIDLNLQNDIRKQTRDVSNNLRNTKKKIDSINLSNEINEIRAQIFDSSQLVSSFRNKLTDINETINNSIKQTRTENQRIENQANQQATKIRKVEDRSSAIFTLCEKQNKAFVETDNQILTLFTNLADVTNQAIESNSKILTEALKSESKSRNELCLILQNQINTVNQNVISNITRRSQDMENITSNFTQFLADTNQQISKAFEETQNATDSMTTNINNVIETLFDDVEENFKVIQSEIASTISASTQASILSFNEIEQVLETEAKCRSNHYSEFIEKFKQFEQFIMNEKEIQIERANQMMIKNTTVGKNMFDKKIYDEIQRTSLLTTSIQLIDKFEDKVNDIERILKDNFEKIETDVRSHNLKLTDISFQIEHTKNIITKSLDSLDNAITKYNQTKGSQFYTKGNIRKMEDEVNDKINKKAERAISKIKRINLTVEAIKTQTMIQEKKSEMQKKKEKTNTNPKVIVTNAPNDKKDEPNVIVTNAPNDKKDEPNVIVTNAPNDRKDEPKYEVKSDQPPIEAKTQERVETKDDKVALEDKKEATKDESDYYYSDSETEATVPKQIDNQSKEKEDIVTSKQEIENEKNPIVIIPPVTRNLDQADLVNETKELKDNQSDIQNDFISDSNDIKQSNSNENIDQQEAEVQDKNEVDSQSNDDGDTYDPTTAGTHPPVQIEDNKSPRPDENSSNSDSQIQIEHNELSNESNDRIVKADSDIQSVKDELDQSNKDRNENLSENADHNSVEDTPPRAAASNELEEGIKSSEQKKKDLTEPNSSSDEDDTSPIIVDYIRKDDNNEKDTPTLSEASVNDENDASLHARKELSDGNNKEQNDQNSEQQKENPPESPYDPLDEFVPLVFDPQPNNQELNNYSSRSSEITPHLHEEKKENDDNKEYISSEIDKNAGDKIEDKKPEENKDDSFQNFNEDSYATSQTIDDDNYVIQSDHENDNKDTNRTNESTDLNGGINEEEEDRSETITWGGTMGHIASIADVLTGNTDKNKQ